MSKLPLHMYKYATVTVSEYTGPKLLLHRKETFRGGLGSRPFKITPTQWCRNECPYVRPHPGLTNLEYGRVYLYFC